MANMESFQRSMERGVRSLSLRFVTDAEFPRGKFPERFQLGSSQGSSQSAVTEIGNVGNFPGNGPRI